ncbi:MAG: hypothetical protein AB1489_23985 [Acidobacteriota bacterium]
MRKIRSKQGFRLFIAVCWIAGMLLAVFHDSVEMNKVQAFADPFPNYSSPIVLNNGNRFVWVVNPDNNSVTRIDVGNEPNFSAIMIPVGREPQSLVLSGDDTKVYVANAVDGTVSVISTATNQVTKTIKVGSEPRAVVLSPNGTRLYVANSTANSVSVIDTKTDTVIKTIEAVGSRPYALAITNDGDFDDNDERLYVTNFISEYRAGTIRPGADDGKEGLVYVINTATNTIFTTVAIQPMADTGFKSNGSALKRVAPGPANAPNLVTTGAFPNFLNSIVIKGTRAYVPNTGMQPDGPVVFSSNVQSLLSAIDLQTNQDAGLTVNMNFGIQFEPDKFDTQNNPLTRFVTVPYALAFKNRDNTGYVVSAMSDMIVKVDLDAQGRGTINAPKAAGDAGNVVRILVGKNPRGIIINDADTRAYVMNYVSRDVTVVDILNNRAIATVPAAPQPSDSLGKLVQRGKELFNTSIGPLFDGQTAAFKGQGRMSNHGFGGCFECHPDGLGDGVVWMFPDGPRRAIPLNWTFDKRDPSKQRLLNWSAIRDEVQDFELNTRNVSGGAGLIRLANGDPDPMVFNLTPLASSGRNPDQDAIEAYVRTIRSPISPFSDSDKDVVKGRKIFEKAGCVNCHSGGTWSGASLVDFTPPPPADRITNGRIVSGLKQVGTFDANKSHEIIGTGANIGKTANGADGFVPASLLGAFFNAPYLHDGSALTIEDVLANPAHVGTSPLLTKPKKRAQLIKFILSIDDSTQPFPIKK